MDQDWYYRETAIMTFQGSFLESPDSAALTPLVTQALPLLIDMMGDINLHVRTTFAWTFGRIVKPDVHLHQSITALVTGLNNSPRAVTLR